MSGKIRRSVPFNKEPYYPPGYSGYTPQLVFRFGDTFGKATHKMLTDSEIARSKNSVLNEIIPLKVKDSEDDISSPQSLEWLKETWGDRKYVDPMMPGYSAYIPNGEEFFGRRYTKICSLSNQSFKKRINSHKEKRNYSPLANDLKLPLKPLNKQLQSERIDKNQIDLSIIGDKPVTFPCTYSGFIPRSRSRFAKSYRRLTNEAIKEFVHDTRMNIHLSKRAIDLSMQSQQLHETDFNVNTPVYREEGVIPNYNGFLPGHKYRYGATYGASSRKFFAS